MDKRRLKSSEVVQKALEFLRSRRDTHTTVADVVAFVSSSPANLRRIFKLVTGKSVRATLCEIRIEKARRLLHQTSLDVTEVGFAAGFENSSSFGRTFRKATGTSPGLFRKAIQDAAEPTTAPFTKSRPIKAGLVVRDDFETGRLAKWWAPEQGDWKTQDGMLQGTGARALKLSLTTPLPENFRLEFAVRIMQSAGMQICLQTAAGGTPYRYCEVSLPHNHGPGALLIRERNVLFNPDAFMKPEGWHAVRLEVNDNRIAVALDGKSVFAFRDIFPPNYSDRNRFTLASYRTTLELRHLRLLDLGFPPVVPTVRQGDALFNAGLYQQAKDFYLHHLLPNLPAKEEMELRFKIGVCLLRQSQFDRCQKWVRATLPLAKDPFWHHECVLLLIRLEASAGRLDAFESRVRQEFGDPLMRDGIRPLLRSYYSDLRDAGFHDRALRVAALTLELEHEHPGQSARARELLATPLKNLQRFPQAKRQLRLQSRTAPEEYTRWTALISLSDICLLQKKLAAARELIAKVRQSAAQKWVGAFVIQEVICLRTEQRFREAVATLLAIRADHPSEKNLHLDAEIEAAKILCCLGERTGDQSSVTSHQSSEKQFSQKPITDHCSRFTPAQYRAAAHDIVKRLRKEFQKPDVRQSDLFNEFALVARLVEKRHEESAAILLRESRRQDGPLTMRGQEAVIAGILFELADKPDEARQAWLEASRRFPPARCYFWGSLAKALAAGKPDQLEAMQLFYRVRSEMFYLAGLLYKHRGNAARAKRLFALAVKEDPTLNWPAHLAMLKLAAGP